MEPLIQYTTTTDGVNIAYATMGEGPPVVFMPVLPLSHLQVEWQMPGMREFLEQFGATYRLVRFDARGLGLSDRSDSERTLDAHVRDLEAVVQRAGLSRFALFAASYSGPVAIRYAAVHPEQVSRLILWCTHAYHAEVIDRLPKDLNQQRMAVNNLAGVDRDLYIRTYLHRAVGWTEGETASRFVDVAKQSIDTGKFFENLANHAAFDARDDLPNVKCPVLVLHRPEFIGSSVDVAKGLAARMPNARLVLVEGQSVVPFIGDSSAVVQAALAFLDEDAEVSEESRPDDDLVRTILYSDIEDHSAMMQRLGDARGREVLREYERVTRELLRAHGGQELRAMGDGFLASFRSTQSALRCAIELQRALAGLPELHGEHPQVRIGLNAGEPISDGDELHGNAVQMAAEIARFARGGQICVSLVVRELVAGKGFQFGAPLEVLAGGGDAPVRVYPVGWREAVPQ